MTTPTPALAHDLVRELLHDYLDALLDGPADLPRLDPTDAPVSGTVLDSLVLLSLAGHGLRVNVDTSAPEGESPSGLRLVEP